MTDRTTLVLTRADVSRLLSMRDCIDAVEAAFRAHAEGRSIPPGVLGVHLEHGGVHVKTAGLLGEGDQHATFATKVNANFPENTARFGLPTIQGVVALFDAENGRLLALLDSIEITSLRTAAATAVAAKYLARRGPSRVALAGCGEQSRSQLRALACVRELDRVSVHDVDRARAARFAAEMSPELGVGVDVVSDFRAAARESDLVVTCTTSRDWILGRGDVRPGAFVAGVGVDNPDKRELEPALMASRRVVCDVLSQCEAIGDLHHAIAAGAMTRADVHAELADVVAERRPGRTADDEIFIFDSTGTALQDVAAAQMVYERALAVGAGLSIALG